MIRAGNPAGKPSADLWPHAALLIGVFLLWLLRFEYEWASGDQDEFIPLILHLLDPSILATDWFVGTQTAGIGVRTYFALLLKALCTVIPPWLAVAFLFVTVWLAIAAMVHAILRAAGGSKLAAGFVVVATLVLTPKWTLGGNDLVYHMLVPEMIAWAIGLGAMLAFFRSNNLAAGALLGLASWFQILAGLHLLALCGCAMLLLTERRQSAGLATLISSFAVASLPATIPIGMQQLESIGGEAAQSITYILAGFRAPYHFLPAAFPSTAYIKFGLLAVGAALSWGLLARQHKTGVRLLAGIFVSGLVIVCVAALFTTVVQIDFVVKLQLFKTTVVLKLCAIAMLALAADEMAKRWGFRVTWAAPWSRRFSAMLLVLIAVSALSIAAWNVVQHGPVWVRWSSEQDSDLSNVERWAATYTALDATFAVPPSNSTFRSRAKRPIVVNYAAIPYEASDMREWYSRIQSIAPVENPITSIALKSQLDESFHNLSVDAWRRLAERYEIDYLLVRRSEQQMELPFAIAYQNDSWIVHRLRTDDESGA